MSATVLRAREAEAVVLLTTQGREAYRLALGAVLMAHHRGNPMELMEHLYAAHCLMKLPPPEEGPLVELDRQVEMMRCALVESSAELVALRARVEALEKPKPRRRKAKVAR